MCGTDCVDLFRTSDVFVLPSRSETFGIAAVEASAAGVPVIASAVGGLTDIVVDGETFEVAFVADNPGIWMDHCHNLKHAADGMVAHLMYAGVTTPYVLGGPQNNLPE